MATKKSDAFILTRNKVEYTNSTRPVIRVSKEAYNILADMVNESNMSMSQVASQAIKFAYDHLEFENKEGEIDDVES